MEFDYNQLNIVGRDKSNIEYIEQALISEIDRLRSKVDVNGDTFKHLVSVANQVWAGEDKEIFLQKLTRAAEDYQLKLETLRNEIRKYLTQDLSDFADLQKTTQTIAESMK